jgi:hypothetical protein
MDTVNTPYSIKRPRDWDGVAAYSRGEAKPTKEAAQRAFDELLRNIRLENCVYHPEVVNAMLRRAPGRIEAENYGHRGRNVSYAVKNSAQHSAFYRTAEPVTIKLGGEQRRRSEPLFSQPTKWTAWIASDQSGQCDPLRVRADQVPRRRCRSTIKLRWL